MKRKIIYIIFPDIPELLVVIIVKPDFMKIKLPDNFN